MNSQVIYVLLVEDDIDYSALLRRRLMGGLNKDAEQTFIVAQTGLLNEAIDYAAHHPIDVVVLDLNLPDTTGLNTLVRVREAVPNAATIVLTGRDDQELAVKAMTMGAHDYLYKGNFNTELLVRSIRYAIDRQQSEQALSQAEEKLRTAQSDSTTKPSESTSRDQTDAKTNSSPEAGVSAGADTIANDFDTLLARMAAQNLWRSRNWPTIIRRVHIEKLNQTINLATDLTRRLFNGIRGNSHP
ncbi:MAG: response regulator [Caldilineaceae bacterium]